MKKFSRCVLILILILILSAAGGYAYEDSKIIPMYTSMTQLYVVPGTANEASVRASNGGLKDDFMIVFKSSVVIADAQKTLGTSEDIASYLTISSPPNSNIVQITCTNPDQATAKNYVDAVAKTAIKTTTIIPVQSIQILSEGTTTNVSVKPDLMKKTLKIAGVSGVACLIVEILVLLVLSAFKKPNDHSDDEFEYERHYGSYAALGSRQTGLLTATDAKASEVNVPKKAVEEAASSKAGDFEMGDGDMNDILAEFDEDYAEDEDMQDVDAAFDYVAASAEQNEQDEKTESEEAPVHKTSQLTSSAQILGTIKK